MTSREQILAAVKNNQPELTVLPLLDEFFQKHDYSLLDKFTEVLTGIGGTVTEVENIAEAIAQIKAHYTLDGIRVVSPLESMKEIANVYLDQQFPHELENVELAILPVHFAVAENGACWVSEELFSDRVLPFITQHLVLILNKTEILPTMHEAYERIGGNQYGFGTFIAGPSKTADIEQSLVLGAHGARSLWVFII
jgi:L-lactate dehydrogenase complex protein LldG